MTPGQIALVEQTLTWVDLDALAEDFYRRALSTTPELTAMFTSDPVVQRARFAAELAEIVRSIRSLDNLASTARPLGARHRGYGGQRRSVERGDRGGLDHGLQPHGRDHDDGGTGRRPSELSPLSSPNAPASWRRPLMPSLA